MICRRVAVSVSRRTSAAKPSSSSGARNNAESATTSGMEVLLLEITGQPQACGCPVISSKSTSIPEVVADSALLRAPDDEEGFAADVLRLTDTATRRQIIARGLENAKRFTPERMVNDYLELYQKVCASN